MKTPLAFPALFLLLAWAIFTIACGPEDEIDNPLPAPEEKICNISIEVKKFVPGKNDYLIDTILVPYRCDQVIVSGQQSLNVLLDTGYTIIDSCSCADSLYLLENLGVDPIGIIDNPPPGTKDSSLSLNFLPPLPELDSLKVQPDQVNSYNPDFKGVPTVRIGVVDTGVDTGSVVLHPFLWINTDLDNKCPGYSFSRHGLDLSDQSSPHPMDRQGHGSHVSGIAAGLSPNLSFSLPDVRLELITAKVSKNARNTMDLFTATCGIHYALDQGADVINLSWGYLDSLVTVKDKEGNDKKVLRPPLVMLGALEEARDKGVVIVAALGNDGQKLGDGMKFWPASFAETWDNVIAVGASTDAGGMKLAKFSNHYGNDILAPGQEIVSVVPEIIWHIHPPGSGNLVEKPMPGGWAVGTGTSMSAPFVTRTVAFMMAKRRPANVGDYKAHLPLAPSGFDPQAVINSW